MSRSRKTRSTRWTHLAALGFVAGGAACMPLDDAELTPSSRHDSPAAALRAEAPPPPTAVTCPDDGSATAGETIDLTAIVGPTARPPVHRWSLLGSPPGSGAKLEPRDGTSASLWVDRAGTYKLAFCVDAGLGSRVDDLVGGFFGNLAESVSRHHEGETCCLTTVRVSGAPGESPP